MSSFDASVPTGFHYRDDFITGEDEASLAEQIARLEFSTFEMRGIVSRFSANRTTQGPHRLATLPAVSRAVAQPGRAVGRRGFAVVRDGVDQRVPARRSHRLASRHTAVRHRDRHFLLSSSGEVPSSLTRSLWSDGQGI